MEIGVIEAGKYFKGLLLLIRKDHRVTGTERDLVTRIGRRLGFEKEFCDTAIQDILKNKFIEDSPPVFSSKELAMMFIKDGFAVAFSDNELDYKEEKWLAAVADKNMIDPAWFALERDSARNLRGDTRHLEVDKLEVVHSA